ncbi:MAG: hypothetical protein HDR88_12400 [Bacteroides sp.]|nr:hypothetical protein [Bacteroides sp.]
MRDTAIERLQNAQTYLFLDGIDDAIRYYTEAKDTTSLLQMYQIAAIKMRWKGEEDSASMYLHKALNLSTPATNPSTTDICIDLSRLYSHPLLRKNYIKALEYAHEAARADTGGESLPRILHDIGIYYAFMNEQDSAAVYISKAISCLPEGSPYYETFALNYANLSSPDFTKSIGYLDSIKSRSLGRTISKGFLYLNYGILDSAAIYLKQSQDLYESAPERFSINTYNSLRLLQNCVSFARTGKVYPGEGTVTNDSVSERIFLNKRIDAEMRETNTVMEIELLKSKSRNLTLWIIVLVLILIGGIAFALIYWKNKHKYIQLREEFDRLRQNQIIVESDDNEQNGIVSMNIIRTRAEICIERFRQSGLPDLIQKGEAQFIEHDSYLPLKDRTLIRQKLLECFADFIIDIKMNAGKLVMDDIITALLSLMRTQNTAIAACLGVSVAAVRTRKTRLKAKLSKNMEELIFG